MSTINSKPMVDAIIAANGEYEGDPPVLAIVQYNNDFNGAPAYGLCYCQDDVDGYLSSPHCHNTHIIFRRVEEMQA